MQMVFVGVDWAEAHHDVCLLDELGKVLGKRRIPDGLEGVRRLHELVPEHAEEPQQVVVGIETDRGLLVQALLAAGYQVYAVNPLAVSPYRDRHSTSRAKSDAGDAKLLTDLVRTDRHNHRPIAGDSELAGAIQVLARAHQNLVWSPQRQVNQLRNTLREFYPGALEAFGTDLAGVDSVAILERASTPSQGRSISQVKIVSALRKAGRERNLQLKAAEIQGHLRAPQLVVPPLPTQAYGRSVTASVRMLRQMNQELTTLERELAAHFEMHPDAETYLSLPGLGFILGARVLAEFGDDRTRFDHPKARKSMPATRRSPRPPASTRWSWPASLATDGWPTPATSGPSPHLPGRQGARRYYDQLRGRGKTHHQALRAVANRLVGILHGCITHREPYREDVACPALEVAA
jgi:transposase